MLKKYVSKPKTVSAILLTYENLVEIIERIECVSFSVNLASKTFMFKFADDIYDFSARIGDYIIISKTNMEAMDPECFENTFIT